ncbi:MAG: type II toxin-antitoxin system PemK/MazF family toxin [Proteobacteria bacterium]|nr:type II toxin-antitoxin system PemK/MazF family toxin [Pseudomonadota bacterium]
MNIPEATKNFDDWNTLKKKLDENRRAVIFKERDVWWCSIGLNVGHEENGKNQFFTRPVLVVRKFNRHLFFGIPLTTKIKENKYYHRITFKDEGQCAMLSQLKIFESKRMRSRMGELPHRQFNEIRKKIAEMILGE